MKAILKQVLGIDVSQKELVVCLGRMNSDLSLDLYATKTFANNPKGFDQLVSWRSKMTEPSLAVRFVMEATGVYHEALAYFLDSKGLEVSIVLPNKISNFSRTLEVKTKTDKSDSEVIARFGLERKLDTWKKPRKIFRNLKQLTRERDQIIQDRTVAKNQLHAEQTEAFPYENSLNRVKDRIRLLNKQEAEIKKEIAALVKQDVAVSKSVDLICTIPGVALLTAATVLGETNGFELIRNKRQLASYAGLDVREKESGTSIHGKARISKKGNRHLRKAMYLPALAAIRFNERYKATFVRLVSRHGIKMKAAVAVQRKMLELIYVLYKNNTAYDKNYAGENRLFITT